MAGTPDVLSSQPAPSGRRWLAVGLALVVVGVGVTVTLVDDGADRTEPVAAPTSATPIAPAAALTIAAGDRVIGSLPASDGGQPFGNAAIQAARAVADSYCERISSWRITVDGADGEYRSAVILLRPAGPAYRDVALVIELTWDTDHYDWAGSRTALESCP